jgi:hypothetical protein
LPTSSSVSIVILALHTLFICLSFLGWYIHKEDQDLAVQGLELFSPIVQGNSCAGDLEREAVRRRLPIHLAVMSHNKMSLKLLEDTTLASRMLRIFVYTVGLRIGASEDRWLVAPGCDD